MVCATNSHLGKSKTFCAKKKKRNFAFCFNLNLGSELDSSKIHKDF